MQEIILAFLSVERNVNESVYVNTQKMGTMTHAGEKLRKLIMQGLIFKTVRVCSEHSCGVAVIY